MYTYFMPTKIFFGLNCISENHQYFKLGKKAFIVTSPSSFKNNAINDVITALKKNQIDYYIYSSIEQNPSTEQIEHVSRMAIENKADFVIGIGGGSPLDAAKAIAVLAANSDKNSSFLFEGKIEKCLPIISVPTTCGTGSEVTQYSILTLHNIQNKKSFSSELIFSKFAFIDYKYLETLPYEILVDTSFDALSHIIEGFLSNRNNTLIYNFASKGLLLYSEIKEHLINKRINMSTLENLAYISLIGGIVIAHTGTLVVHPLGYNYTYFHGIPHGRANAILLSNFLYLESKYIPNDVNEVLKYLDFKYIEDFNNYVSMFYPNVKPKLTEDEIDFYSSRAIASKNVNSLKHEISLDELKQILK
ncbi:iron-containing alcohol dehydrogenase [Caldicellulosiruptoraceae bacterium PP1]